MIPFGLAPVKQLVSLAIVVASLISVALVIRGNNPRDLYTRHMNAGYRYYDSHEYTRVVSECAAALALRSHSVHARLLQGTAYSKLNQDRQAIGDYTAALTFARTPDDLGAIYYNRGLSYERLNEYAQAVKDFTECLRYTPGNYQALFERADCYRTTGNPTGAIADVNFYLQRGHSSYYAFYIRGQAYVIQRKWRESVADFKRELQLKPDDGIGWGALGWSQYMVRDLDGAIESDRTALRLRPNLVYARYNLGLCFAVQNRWDRAQPEYEKAVQNATPFDLKSALEDIDNGLSQVPGLPALANAKQLVVSAQR